MKNQIIKSSLLIALFLVACSPKELDKLNPNGGTPESYYSNQDELTKGVNAVYAAIKAGNLTARYWWFTQGLRSDEMASGGGQLGVEFNQILTGTLSSTNSCMTPTWIGYYQGILKANAVIVAAPKVDSSLIKTTLKNRLVGEAKFLRAWNYFELVYQWGGVPLYTTPSTSISDTKPRASVDDVYKQIIEDLTFAESNLPIASQYTGADVGRATKGAADALLGRVYMQRGDFATAKTYLQKVYNSNQYVMTDSFEDNFKEETGFNKESIFEIGFTGGANNFNWDFTGADYGPNYCNAITQEISSIGWRNMIPSDGLLADFERVSKGDAKNDPRFAVTFVKSGDKIVNNTKTLDTAKVQGNLSNFEGKKEKISWRKYTSIYKNDDGFYVGPMDIRIIRYADVLLMLAECENETGNTSAAIGYLNKVRSRASVSMPAYPTANYPCSGKDDTFKAIVHERRVELANEQCRNRDLLRWRSLGRVGAGKLIPEPITQYVYEDKFKLLPIPSVELTTNANVSQKDQNPGY